MPKDYQISVLLDFYGQMLTEKQRDMVDYYYNDDLSLSEIAENEAITRQGVRDSIKRAESQLFLMEERLGLAKRFSQVKDGLEEILVAARDIELVNINGSCSREIAERIRRIIRLAETLNE